MSVIGLDFGSHTLSISLYYEDKDLIEVIADDLGSRTIPCCVAFRNGEILTGQAALAQQHKNPLNTFDELRTILLNCKDESTLVNIPSLEKEIPVLELVSHFFRNVSNQVKQQVGKPVKDCIISLPEELSPEAKERLVKSAQAGGLRIKSILTDPISILMAYNMDDPSVIYSKAVVIDMGWSKTEVSLFDIRGGMFSQLGLRSCTTACGRDIVRIMSEHCAKDFQRKSSCSCVGNSKAMMRLRGQCEVALKSLSTAAEVTLDIDSLYEGMDYSSRLSRARFEDLCAGTFAALRVVVSEAVSSVAGLQSSDVTHVLVAGTHH